MKRVAIVTTASLFGATFFTAQCRDRPVWNSNWDHREASSFCKPGTPDEVVATKQSKVRRKLFLIRHGQYVHEPTDEKRVLTELGRKQAECTGNRLAELGVKYSDVVISTMTRARETGDIILEQIPAALEEDHTITRTDILVEGSPIEAVPRIRFKPDQYEFEDGPRIEAAFRRFFHRAHYDQTTASHEVIVCHANVIRYFVCRATQNPPEGWLRMSLANGSITEVVIEPNGQVYVMGVGDKGHLPVDMITFN